MLSITEYLKCHKICNSTLFSLITLSNLEGQNVIKYKLEAKHVSGFNSYLRSERFFVKHPLKYLCDLLSYSVGHIGKSYLVSKWVSFSYLSSSGLSIVIRLPL